MAGIWIRRKFSKSIKKLQKMISDIPHEIRRMYAKKSIKSRDFTIISNNCWAGKAYQYFDMPYLSPTVGLYFFADDYIKFVKNLRYYLSRELSFISAESSKYSEVLKDRNQTDKPIGVLDDIEIVFLHYKSEQEAKEKWDRRKKRVNFENIFIKFSNMNFCTDKHIKEFDELSFANKFVLNIHKEPRYSCEYYWSGLKNDKEILNDTSPYPGNLKLTKLLNKKPERYPEEGLHVK